MKFTTFVFTVIIGLFVLPLRAVDSLELVAEIPLETDFFTTDQLGNIYCISRNRIYKYNRQGKLVQQYSNNRFGKVQSVDATDPYKTIAFYKDFRQVIILDNMLSDNGSPLDLQFTQFDQPILACRAYNTGIWLFDQLLNRVYRLNLSLEEEQSTGNLVQVLGHEVGPNFMIEYNNLLYISNPETGILVFDQYGTYIKSIAITGLTSFQVKEEYLYYFEDQQLKRYHFKTLDFSAIELSDEDVLDCRIDNDMIFVRLKDRIRIYRYRP